MSKFNTYARRLDNIARETFADFRAVEATYRAAEKNRRAIPQKEGIVSAEYVAKSARVHADFIEAEAAYRKGKRTLEERMDELQSIRGELAQAVENEFSADPTKLDMATLELLKSGIMSEDEIVRLAHSAMNENNATMARLIGKYAKERADAMKSDSGRDEPAAQSLRVVAAECQQYNGSAWLDAFDYLTDVYRRTVRTPSLIDRWDEMTAQTIENF